MTFRYGHDLNKGNKYALGMRHTEEWKKEARKRMLGNTNGFVKGKPSPRKGKKSNAPAWNKGIKMPKQSGIHHWNWVQDRTILMEKHRLRSSVEWRNWRNSVFKRDGYICQECNKKSMYLEPHHIIPIRDDMSRIFDIGNGIALCRPCHEKTIKKESEFSEGYFAKVNAKSSSR